MLPQMSDLPAHVRVAVVGAGFAGIGMAAALLRQGMTDLVVLERAGSVGGTWRDNTYPGCACDVPSHLYSYSFAPNPEWSHSFSRQPEIRSYLERTAAEQGVLPYVHLRTELEAAHWDDAAQLWRLRTSRGALTTRILVSGCGALAEPALPDVPGLASFEGTAFHSSRWDHDADLDGKRVAVIGTGASAIQFVPHLQRQVSHLTLFQRTPPWIVPRADRPITAPERALFRRLPAVQKLFRGGVYGVREVQLLAFTGRGRLRSLGEKGARRHLERSVADPQLRELLTPTYRMGCKRILISNDYYPAVAQPNVTVVPQGVREVRPRSVVAADGGEHEVDAIVFGTGFHVLDIPVARRITGRSGESLVDHWAGKVSAHRGTTVAGFPNLFLLLGPNTTLGHTSVVLMIEAQIAYVLRALAAMDAAGATSIDVRPAAQAVYNAGLQARLASTVWTRGGCKAWYTDESGHNFTLWPGHTYTFRRQLSRFDAEAYEFSPALPRRAAAGAG
jgi:cation diffusion facilitator CzcD-associated flavoprotein CzcO